MDPTRWSAILSRICQHDADDLDAFLEPFDQRPETVGRDVFPLPDAVLMPQVAFKRSDAVCVGFRASIAGSSADNVADRATRLAAFAIERDAQVVILSDTDTCGFERFGYRVERISGETAEARAACEDQIRRFWNLDLLL